MKKEMVLFYLVLMLSTSFLVAQDSTAISSPKIDSIILYSVRLSDPPTIESITEQSWLVLTENSLESVYSYENLNQGSQIKSRLLFEQRHLDSLAFLFTELPLVSIDSSQNIGDCNYNLRSDSRIECLVLSIYSEDKRVTISGNDLPQVFWVYYTKAFEKYRMLYEGEED